MPLSLSGSLIVNGSVNVSGSLGYSGSFNQNFYEFIGNFTQTSTNNPVVYVYSNTFNQTIEWTRSTAGQYTAVVSGSHPNMIVMNTSFSSPIIDRVTYSFAQLSGNYLINVWVRKISDNTFADLGSSSGFTLFFRSYL